MQNTEQQRHSVLPGVEVERSAYRNMLALSDMRTKRRKKLNTAP